MARTREVPTLVWTPALGRAARLLCLALTLTVPGISAQQMGLLRGRVLDADTQQPIATVSVSIVGPGGVTLVTGTTDANGRFRIPVLDSGGYTVRAERIGYKTAERGPMSLSPTDTVDVELRMSPAPVLLDSILVSVRKANRRLRRGEQLVYGRLLDDSTHDPIPGATVRLLSNAGTAASTLSDDDGHFWLVSPHAGSYRLQGERIGYKTSEGPELQLMLGDSVGVTFYLSTQAVLLAPITVTASSRPWGNRANLKGMENFFTRYARFGSGYGQFMTRDSIAQWESRVPDVGEMLMADLPEAIGVVPLSNMDMGGAVILSSMGSKCVPRYYLNGSPVPYSTMSGLAPEDLEAVEIYVRPNIPAEFQQSFPCGVVVEWTRRSPGGHLTHPTYITGAIVAVLVAVGALLIR